MLKDQSYRLDKIVQAGALVIALMTFLLTMAFFFTLSACDDDARLEEHNKLTDRLLAIGDEQVQLRRYMEYLDQLEKEEVPSEEMVNP